MRRLSRSARPGGLLALSAVLVLTGAAPSSESWDAVYIAGSKVGHIHTYIEPVRDKEKDRDLVRVRVDLDLKFRRLKDEVTMSMEYGTIEKPDGSVLRLDTRIHAAQQVIRVFGDVVDDKMKLTMETGGQRQQSVLAWSPEVRGPYAAEMSLSRSPIKPGEARSMKMYMPDLNDICDITLTAKSMEDVTLGGGVVRQLLRVDQTTALKGKPRPEFDVSLWVDPTGQVLKSKTDTLGGMVTYRTTKEGALAENAREVAAQFDQIENSVIKIVRKIPRPETTRDVLYRVTLKEDDPSKIIPADRRQSLKSGEKPNEAILEIKTAGPDVGEPGPETVDDEYLRSNPLIASADPMVSFMARKAVAGSRDPWIKAKNIEHYVAKNIKHKNFKIGFAAADEVARNMEGDCTEHGVLVAAMCRAEKVPARVVVGLIYVADLGGFGFHMWNEVYVNRRWVAIDATFEQDDVDAVHIKLSDSSLAGVSPFESFLPVVRVLGKMSLETIEIR
jgi:transglutaminase-like putative cysteine protease